ncbi:MAG: hypothetical protein M3167_08915 [Acidobacteriota bacterium]|nr:hypothetical protein [Acidobacteriota bacterium]
MSIDLRQSGAPVARGQSRLLSAASGLRAVASAAAVVVGACLALLDFAWNGSFLVGVVVLCAWIGVSRMPRREKRPPWSDLERALLPLAFFLRGGALLATFAFKEARGVVSYNVDVRSFILWAEEIAERLPVLLDIRPYDLAGTYDVGFQYFLAFVLWLPGGSLLAAQTLVAVAGTGTAYLAYRIARPLLGSSALWCGLVLALAPNAVFLASADLMKDSLLTFSFLLAIFAAQRIYAARSVDPASLVMLFCGFVLTRLIRVYAGALLEIGLVGWPMLVWWRARRRSVERYGARRWARRAVLVLGILVGAEGILLVAAGEPLVAVEMGSMAGWLKLPSARSAFFGPRGRLEAMLEEEPGFVKVEEKREGRDKFSLRHFAFELLRRFYGPFVWAPPGGNAGFEFLIGNWSAWLEAPLWYALFPFGILGLWSLARRERWDAWFLASSGAALVVALIVFSVTHRQRTSNLLPLLSIAAVAGWNTTTARQRRILLSAQAVIVLGLAAAYWSFRLLHPV